MICPKCGAKAGIIDTRKGGGAKHAQITRRRYRCHANANHRWSSVEQIVHASRKGHGGKPLIDVLKATMRKEAQGEIRGQLHALLGVKT